MKKVIILTLFLSAHWAQSQHAWDFGIHAGVGTTLAQYSNIPKYYKKAHHVNYQGGMWVKHNILKYRINVESALIFYRRTEELTSTHLDEFTPNNGVLLTEHFQWQNWMLRLPLLAGYNFEKMSITIGPGLNYVFSAKNSYWIEAAGYESYEQYAHEQGYDLSKVPPPTPPKENYILYGLELHAGYNLFLADRPARIEISGNRSLTRLDDSYPYTYDFDIRLIYFLKPV